MFCLENLMYRCRYQTDTSVWINCIFHFCKGKREWKWCPGASFSLFGSKQISVWQTSICLKRTSQTIHCNCLCLTIVLYPTHDICLHVCSASWDTRPGLLCRLDSTTRPRYAVSSEPWPEVTFCQHSVVDYGLREDIYMFLRFFKQGADKAFPKLVRYFFHM